MRFPQQTVRPRRPPKAYYIDSSSEEEDEATSVIEYPLPLGTQPRFTMLLRSPASLRKLKGKDVANYDLEPPPPKKRRKRRYYYLRRAQEHTCEHCNTAAESSGSWRPLTGDDALSEHSVWDLDEVDPVDLRGAVFNLSILLEQEKVICLATIKLKYEKRRQRIPKWLQFSRGVLDPLEKREYDRKRRELDGRLLNEIMHYEASVKARFADRRHSAPEARPAGGFLGYRRQGGVVFPRSI